MRAVDLNEIRLRRIRQIINERHDGNNSKFADRVGMQGAYASRLWTERLKHKRNIGEKLARRIEEAHGLAKGWLDYDESLEITDKLLLTGYQAASPESRELMEEIARRALRKPLSTVEKSNNPRDAETPHAED
jgi:hypothetical protein